MPEMKNEARRLQKEREAIEKEKAQVLEDEKRASSKSKPSGLYGSKWVPI